MSAADTVMLLCAAVDIDEIPICWEHLLGVILEGYGVDIVLIFISGDPLLGVDLVMPSVSDFKL